MRGVINLEDLFINLLKDIYYAEKKILKALPRMAKAVGEDSHLGNAFRKHFQETQGQIERLEKVFEIVEQRPRGKTCEAIDGIIEEAEELMREVECLDTLEAGLLAGAQAVEHYEMARYGTLVEWAQLLGHDDAADLLEQTLDQEKRTNEILNDLAIREINQHALEAQEEREREEEGPKHGRRRAA
jgi:ferritin-like metal-binding protein YciE